MFPPSLDKSELVLGMSSIEVTMSSANKKALSGTDIISKFIMPTVSTPCDQLRLEGINAKYIQHSIADLISYSLES
ncbi:hypothetical protein [Alteromonas mediterranea]|uniref:Uncharacterized protein n=1 Tax=Alteromonas mediterranea TaxID=314275 RepID=A0AAC8XIM2_9ALTE|nr:hypothetical protein [Alteromonas mediterranea]AGQ00758.1 hypothetical protein I636_04450 [Alteromonas mediterranea UM4b]AMJ77594.1 hypothetical protein AV942_04325 [Alteromonas mediterranea]AMJ81728.1 hypothetical protein AV941_04290 [Alteromonas mediterranea]MAJ71301.1 hypothetical protein [Alteromonadaceae bacterium]